MKLPSLFHPDFDVKTLLHSLKCLNVIVSNSHADNKLLLLRSLEDEHLGIGLPLDHQNNAISNQKSNVTTFFDLIKTLLFHPLIENVSREEIKN